MTWYGGVSASMKWLQKKKFQPIFLMAWPDLVKHWFFPRSHSVKQAWSCSVQREPVCGSCVSLPVVSKRRVDEVSGIKLFLFFFWSTGSAPSQLSLCSSVRSKCCSSSLKWMGVGGRTPRRFLPSWGPQAQERRTTSGYSSSGWRDWVKPTKVI